MGQVVLHGEYSNVIPVSLVFLRLALIVTVLVFGASGLYSVLGRMGCTKQQNVST